MNALTPAQIGYRHFGANPFHHDADLVFGGKLPAARLLGSADQLPRRFLGARQACPRAGLPLSAHLHTPLVLRPVLAGSF